MYRARAILGHDPYFTHVPQGWPAPLPVPEFKDTYLDRAALLSGEIDLDHLVQILVEVLLAPEPLIQLLELIDAESGSVVAIGCLIHPDSISIK